MGLKWTTEASSSGMAPNYFQTAASGGIGHIHSTYTVDRSSDYGKPIKKRGLKFNRLANLIQMEEGATFEEPLDKLRADIFRWLGR